MTVAQVTNNESVAPAATGPQTRYIFEAVESIRLAKNAEEQFEHEQASRLYDTAAHLFITGVQQDTNKSRQELVRKKLAKCLFKAERCRAVSKNKVQVDDSTSAGSNDDPGGGGEITSIPPPITAINWPHDLKLYQLKQVITSDIWLVARIIDQDETKNLALMAGIPKISTISAYYNPHRGSRLGLAHQETVEAIDTSQLQQMELGRALSLRTAAIMYRPNKYHVTTGQKFLQQFITKISLEIRTEYTIFCIVKATEETLDYARNVRRIVTSIRHKDCGGENSCQACRLRQTQRCIRLSSSSSDTADNHNPHTHPSHPRKNSSEDVRRALPREKRNVHGTSSLNTEDADHSDDNEEESIRATSPPSTKATLPNPVQSPPTTTTTPITHHHPPTTTTATLPPKKSKTHHPYRQPIIHFGSAGNKINKSQQKMNKTTTGTTSTITRRNSNVTAAGETVTSGVTSQTMSQPTSGVGSSDQPTSSSSHSSRCPSSETTQSNSESIGSHENVKALVNLKLIEEGLMN